MRFVAAVDFLRQLTRHVTTQSTSSWRPAHDCDTSKTPEASLLHADETAASYSAAAAHGRAMWDEYEG